VFHFLYGVAVVVLALIVHVEVTHGIHIISQLLKSVFVLVVVVVLSFGACHFVNVGTHESHIQVSSNACSA
jgi:uncharacterized membrane protein YidH (DUF202 family)